MTDKGKDSKLVKTTGTVDVSPEETIVGVKVEAGTRSTTFVNRQHKSLDAGMRRGVYYQYAMHKTKQRSKQTTPFYGQG